MVRAKRHFIGCRLFVDKFKYFFNIYCGKIEKSEIYSTYRYAHEMFKAMATLCKLPIEDDDIIIVENHKTVAPSPRIEHCLVIGFTAPSDPMTVQLTPSKGSDWTAPTTPRKSYSEPSFTSSPSRHGMWAPISPARSKIFVNASNSPKRLRLNQASNTVPMKPLSDWLQLGRSPTSSQFSPNGIKGFKDEPISPLSNSNKRKAPSSCSAKSPRLSKKFIPQKNTLTNYFNPNFKAKRLDFSSGKLVKIDEVTVLDDSSDDVVYLPNNKSFDSTNIIKVEESFETDSDTHVNILTKQVNIMQEQSRPVQEASTSMWSDDELVDKSCVEIKSVDIHSTSMTSTLSHSSVHPAQLISYINDMIRSFSSEFALRLRLSLLSTSNWSNENRPKTVELSEWRGNITKMTMQSGEWYLALDTCLIDISEEEYLHHSTLQHILQNALNTSQDDIFGITSMVLSKMISFHPPCTSKSKKYYNRLLTTPYTERLDKMKLLYNMGIFEEVLQKIGEIFTDSAGELKRISLQNEEPNDNYGKLSAKQKVDRLSFVMDYLLTILEQDFLFFLSDKGGAHKKLFNPETRPLLVDLLWPSQTLRTIGVCNVQSRQIIRLFYLTKATLEVNKLLQRLLTLMAEVARCAETKEEPYPSLGIKCTDFAREITNMKPDDVNISTLASKLKPSWLGLLIIHLYITKLMKINSDPSLNVAIKCVNGMVKNLNDEVSNPIPNAGGITPIEIPNKINKRDYKGETRLHRLCRGNKVDEVAKCLLQPGVQVNMPDNYGWTALHEAVGKGHVECVKHLLDFRSPTGESCVNVRAKNYDGVTPLMDAVINSHAQVCKILLLHSGWCLLEDESKYGMTADQLAKTDEVRDVLNVARSYSYENQKPRLACPINIISSVLPVYIDLYLTTYKLHVLRRNIKNLDPWSQKNEFYRVSYTAIHAGLKTMGSLRKLVHRTYRHKSTSHLVTSVISMLQ